MNRSPLLAVLALAACSKDAVKGADDSALDDSAITWYKDVQPIVTKSCATCHGPGGLGGVDLTVYENAAQLSTLMAAYTSGGLMPPPAMDPDCQSYSGDERMNLTDEEIQLIGDWADGDAPMGDPASAPTPKSWGTYISDPDLTLTMPFEHTLNTDTDGNEYFCTILENPLTESTYITGIDVKTGNAAVVHHMILAIDNGGDAGVEYGDNDTSDGFDCRNPIMESDWSAVHAWAPGMDATYFPEGLGIKLEPGDQLVLQMHYYNPGGGVSADQSSYLLRTADDVDKTVQLEAIGPTGFRIPADDANYSYDESITNEWLPINVYGVFPHMHLLGTGYEASMVKEDGTDVCLARGNYDFSHQAFYMYDEPITFEVGDTLTGGCTWDNSAENPNQFNDPPETIHWGEGTNQEMCFFLMYLSY